MLNFSSSNSNGLALSRRDSSPSLGAEAFLAGGRSSPSLGSGQGKSVKKLILDKKVDSTEVFVKSGSSPLRGGKITFSPAMSVAARQKEAAAIAAPPNQEQEPIALAPRPQRTPNRFTASAPETAQSEAGESSTSATLQEGDYWCKPDLPTLKSSGYDQLSSFSGLVVGRVGYGQIEFLEPVDLTGLPKLSALFGDVVRFDDKECTVYPDSEDVDKPPPGSGLNVPAKISLRRCWALDKGTREPVKDETNPAAIKHLKRLKVMKDTHFESFDIVDGIWTFTVDHF